MKNAHENPGFAPFRAAPPPPTSLYGPPLGSWAFNTTDDDVPTVPFVRAEQAEGVRHGFREIHGPRPRDRSVSAIAGAARGPPAISPLAHPQPVARRSRGARRRPDRPFRGPVARAARRGRS